MICMQTKHDCGPVAISNFLEVTCGLPAESTYTYIKTFCKFPNKDNLLDDLWDSPARHRDVVQTLTSRPVKQRSKHEGPAVVLLKLGVLSYHWIVLLSSTSNSATWHDGRTYYTTTGVDSPPYGKVYMSYSFSGDKEFSFIWDVWLGITNLVVR